MGRTLEGTSLYDRTIGEPRTIKAIEFLIHNAVLSLQCRCSVAKKEEADDAVMLNVRFETFQTFSIEATFRMLTSHVGLCPRQIMDH